MSDILNPREGWVIESLEQPGAFLSVGDDVHLPVPDGLRSSGHDTRWMLSPYIIYDETFARELAEAYDGRVRRAVYTISLLDDEIG